MDSFLSRIFPPELMKSALAAIPHSLLPAPKVRARISNSSLTGISPLASMYLPHVMGQAHVLTQMPGAESPFPGSCPHQAVDTAN